MFVLLALLGLEGVELAEYYDEIVSCKMHDLVHDLAKEVAGTEILSSNYSARSLNEKTRHLYIDDNSTEEDFLSNLTKMKRIRTLLYGNQPFCFKQLLGKVSSKLKYLRVLELTENTYLSPELPNMVGKLVHLMIKLEMYRFNEELGPIMRDDTTHALSSSSMFNKKQHQQEEDDEGRLLREVKTDNVDYQEGGGQHVKLREVKTDNVGYLISLPIHSKFQNLSSLLVIDWCENLESLTPSIGCLSSLQSLQITGCNNLESLTPSIGGLSSLQSLIIMSCPKLKTMPKEMRHLTSLSKLLIIECSPEMKKRCEKHTGIYWPNIQHIPDVSIH